MKRGNRSRLTPILGLALLIAADAGASKLENPLFSNGATQAVAGGMRLAGTLGQTSAGGAEHSSSGRMVCHGYWCVGQAVLVAVEDPPDAGPAVPLELSFGAPWPSPARGQVSFQLALPHDSRVRLLVHDVAGRRVSTSPPAQLEAGRHTIRWDGAGEGAGAGVYFALLEIDGRAVGSRRIVLTR